jgi:hypothetical protein
MALLQSRPTAGAFRAATQGRKVVGVRPSRATVVVAKAAAAAEELGFQKMRDGIKVRRVSLSVGGRRKATFRRRFRLSSVLLLGQRSPVLLLGLANT